MEWDGLANGIVLSVKNTFGMDIGVHNANILFSLVALCHKSHYTLFHVRISYNARINPWFQLIEL